MEAELARADLKRALAREDELLRKIEEYKAKDEADAAEAGRLDQGSKKTIDGLRTAREQLYAQLDDAKGALAKLEKQAAQREHEAQEKIKDLMARSANTYRRPL